MIWDVYTLDTFESITESDIWEQIGAYCYSITLEEEVYGKKTFEIISYAEKELLDYVYTLNDYKLLKYERPTNDEIFDYANEHGGLDDIDKLMIESNQAEEELNKKHQL